MTRDQLVTYFAIGVGSIWGLVVIASLLKGEYTALTAITPVMLIVTGFLFGYRDATKNGNGKGGTK